jgi:hypothetical protein
VPYPRDPRWKAPGTSREAAEAISSHGKTVRDRVLVFLRVRYPTSFSADGIAAGLGETF